MVDTAVVDSVSSHLPFHPTFSAVMFSDELMDALACDNWGSEDEEAKIECVPVVSRRDSGGTAAEAASFAVALYPERPFRLAPLRPALKTPGVYISATRCSI